MTKKFHFFTVNETNQHQLAGHYQPEAIQSRDVNHRDPNYAPPHIFVLSALRTLHLRIQKSMFGRIRLAYFKTPAEHKSSHALQVHTIECSKELSTAKPNSTIINIQSTKYLQCSPITRSLIENSNSAMWQLARQFVRLLSLRTFYNRFHGFWRKWMTMSQQGLAGQWNSLFNWATGSKVQHIDSPESNEISPRMNPTEH